jgi:hypothetical protein
MLMKVNAGLPAWFGNVGVARRSQSGGSFCGGVRGEFGPIRAEHTRPTGLTYELLSGMARESDFKSAIDFGGGVPQHGRNSAVA